MWLRPIHFKNWHSRKEFVIIPTVDDYMYVYKFACVYVRLIVVLCKTEIIQSKYQMCQNVSFS